ncbi:hypothetical protein HQ520_01500 [bacterium]|nr:hypothetical protein [bacterium]
MPVVSPLPRKGAIALSELSEQDLRPLKGRRVLIVGDLILDHYLWGEVERTTPEAPVPVVRHERDSWIPGGAANVAHNVAALGGEPRLIGVVGKDSYFDQFRACLRECGVSPRYAVTDPDRPTTVKTRVVSMGQQLLRIDHEDTSPLPPAIKQRLIRIIEAETPNCQSVILSDYAKGALDPEIIAAAIRAAHAAGLPVLADPKGRDYSRYKGVDVLTPNQKETALASGISIRAGRSRSSSARIEMPEARAVSFWLGVSTSTPL